MKAQLLLIGGGESKVHQKQSRIGSVGEKTGHSILNLLCSKPAEARIEILTTGTAYPRELFEEYEQFFQKAGVKDINMLDIDTRYVRSEHLKRAENASSLFIAGGNQRKILEIIGGTPFEAILQERLEKDTHFILAGTSAGAMVMGELAIGDGYHKEKLIKGDVDVRKGMNLLSRAIIDTHFFQSARLSRLSLAVLENPSYTGIGIPENTGVLIKGGDLLEPVGAEMVLLLDASELKETNVKDTYSGDPVYASGMKLHFLNSGSVYSLKKKRLFSIEV